MSSIVADQRTRKYMSPNVGGGRELRGLRASEHRARICKRLWSPGIDSEESISLAI